MSQIYQPLVDSAIGSAVALLDHLTNDELKALLEDDSKLDDLIKDLPHVRNLITEKEMLLAQNKSLAEFNLSQEPKIKAAKQELMENYENVSALQAKVESLLREVEGVSSQRSVETTLALLQTAAAEAEEESEKIAEEFLQRNINVDTFLNKFTEQRTITHGRKLKAEKLAELIHLMPTGADAHINHNLGRHLPY